jgi:CubicO group peptidase (beta-lactamase class C family)
MMFNELEEFDLYIKNIMLDWNCPGLAVGVVVNDDLVFSKGYGYRDYEKKLPFTTSTLFPIASNSKLFTAVAAGLLVEEGLIEFDEPVRDKVPDIRFCNDSLNGSVTLRDMLAHRTGIPRYDRVWYKSDLTRKDIVGRIKVLEPTSALRQSYLYNNIMYAAVGYMVELLTGKRWEQFVREKILLPLEMNDTIYTISDMLMQSDFAVPFNQKRDSTELYKVPYVEDEATAPAGAIISNIQDMSKWLIALINNGQFKGKQVVSQSVLRATMEPNISISDAFSDRLGFSEVLNSCYGMGRIVDAYRGYLHTSHGGYIDGFHSQVSCLPRERIGVVVFITGDHCYSLGDSICFNAYERLLGLTQTPWSERWLNIVMKDKQAQMAARSNAGADRVLNTHPSHAVDDYVGDYVHPAYGQLNIGLQNGHLHLSFFGVSLPLMHFHYDRFDSPDDELSGRWSVNFAINPQGDIDRVSMTIDQSEVVFIRKNESVDTSLLQKIPGKYKSESGFSCELALKANGDLYLLVPSEPEEMLIPYKHLKFKNKRLSDRVYEFVIEQGDIIALKVRPPTGVYLIERV